MPIIKYCDISYNIILPNENFNNCHLKNDKNVIFPIVVIYDESFRCESDTKIIKYRQHIKIYNIGNEIIITNTNHILFRVSSSENIIRQVYEILPLVTKIIFNRETALIHGAGLILNNKGILCVGDSGAGKTTLSNMANMSGEVVLGDELIVYDLKTNNIWGTNIVSNDYLGVPIINKSVKLHRILFLNKSSHWYIEEIKSSITKKIFDLFGIFRLNQITLDDMMLIPTKIGVYNLYFNKCNLHKEVMLHE